MISEEIARSSFEQRGICVLLQVARLWPRLIRSHGEVHMVSLGTVVGAIAIYALAC